MSTVMSPELPGASGAHRRRFGPCGPQMTRNQVERLIELTRLDVDAAVQAPINPAALRLERIRDEESALDGWYDHVLGDVLGELGAGEAGPAKQVLALARVLERINGYAQHVVSVVSGARAAHVSAARADS